MLAPCAPAPFARVVRRVVRGLLFASLFCGVIFSSVDAKPPQAESGQSSRDARDEAIRQLPLQRLNQRDRRRVLGVVNDTAIFRHLPTQSIPCDPQMYKFVLGNPDLVVNLWRVLGISDVSLRRTGPTTFATDDGAGTVGNIEVLLQTPELTLVIAEGVYDGALFTRRVAGKCVMSVRSEYRHASDGRDYAICAMDSFIQIDNVGAELVAKTFQPLVGHFADHNFRETANFLGTLNRAAEVNPTKIIQLTNRMQDVSPEVKEQFIDLTHQLAQRIASRDETIDVSPPSLARRPMNTVQGSR